MTTQVSSPIEESEHPVRMALQDSLVNEKLLRQAVVYFSQYYRDKPYSYRLQEAEECLPKLHIRACEKQEYYHPDVGEIGAWLHGLMLNICREHQRYLQKLPRNELSDVTSQRSEAPDEDMEFEVTAYLEYLDVSERATVEGFYLQGLSHRQIADQMQITESAARQRLRRALMKMRRIAAEGQS